MMRFDRALLGGALALSLVAPSAFSQDYIDLEAERARDAQYPDTSTSPSDPYGNRVPGSYPATSYGVNSAPAAPAGTPTSLASPQPVPVAGPESGGNLGALLMQVQQLQREVMTLNGQLEEQAHELRMLKEQSLERYLDLDRRLGAMAGGGTAGAAVAGAATGAAASTVPAASTGTSRPTSGAANVAEQPGEGEAYRAAYALVRSQQFDQAVSAFQQFLRDYPDGRYAPNAHYWLGELYLVITPQDLEASRQAFSLLLSQYPDNSKVPDALFKLGKVQFLKGNRDRSREYLDRLIRDYGSTNSPAVGLARDFLAENF